MAKAIPQPSTEACVLLVEDDDIMRFSLEDRLRMEGIPTLAAADLAEARRLLARGGIDLVVTDIRLPDGSGSDLFHEVMRTHKGVPVILMTAYGTIPDAVELVKAGAQDYLTKPFRPDELVECVRRTLDEIEGRDTSRMAAPDGTRFRPGSGHLGKSSSMRQIERLIASIAPLDSSVLITGESGVGKEVVANFIHHNSARAGKPFVKVNCAAIPMPLVESELFGHEKGAFTGAVGRRIGRFEQAMGGTIFLDEIAEVPPEVQVKLLRVLQDKVIERVGSGQGIPLDVRVLAATHVDLEPAIESGRFRSDLFWRLNVIRVEVPPLRTRPEDVLFLARRFIGMHAEGMNRTVGGLTAAAEGRLIQHSFPGNVRELKNLMENAVALCAGSRIDLHDLELGLAGAEKPADVTSLRAALEEAEQEAIRAALERSRWAIGQTAALLGISRKNLWEKMRRYGIDRDDRILL